MKTIPALAFALLLSALTAAEKPEYLDSYNVAKGFKPAQRDLTEIFLQLAGSLEEYGSPAPYLRHVAQEHARIEALYRRKFATEPRSYRPAHMTDDYIHRLAANWNLLSPKLGLEPFSKEVGNMMRDTIKGTRGTGTIIVEIFNQQQARVFDEMTGKAHRPADFEALKAQLITRLELNRAQIDDAAYAIPRRDAVRSAIIIHGMTMKLFKRIDQGLKPADAERVKAVLSSVFMDVGQAAQFELEAGIAEWAISRPSTAAK